MLQRLDERIDRRASRSDRTPSEEEQLHILRGQQSDVRGAFVALEHALDARYRAAVGRPSTLADVQAVLPDDVALVGWIDLDSRRDSAAMSGHWACVVRSRGEPTWVRVAGSGPGGAWTQEDKDRPAALRAALMDDHPGWGPIATALEQQRFEPLRAHLSGVRRLVVVPSPALAGLPVETMLAARWPDAPAWAVSYAPSGSMLARLWKRPDAPTSSPELLAVGDPSYQESTPPTTPPEPPDHGVAILAVAARGAAAPAGFQAGDVLLEYNGASLKSAADLKPVLAGAGASKVPAKLWRDGAVHSLEVAPGPLGIELDTQRSPAEFVLAWRTARETLSPLIRGGSWTPLPGTRREVQAIAALFPSERVTTLLGPEATESNLQRLARSGTLKGFRFIHLATHGKADPGVALNSALFLAAEPGPPTWSSADPAAWDSVPDGRVTAEQILRTWDLDADLVVLSACESGLGRHAGGEGYLGFTQALFAKGARSVVLSLWKVDDRATALLMKRFYQNLLGRREDGKAPMPKAEALSEAKAWLRTQSAPDAPATRSGPRTSLKGRAQPAVIRFDHPYYWAGFILIGNPN
jgi:hypothetical protein